VIFAFFAAPIWRLGVKRQKTKKMPVKIRLQRHGKKGRPFFHIVVADGRAPRDGRFIERIGSYNPITNPATIELNHDKAADWMMKGAQPSDTARAILSYKGVLYKVHLNRGVAKGVMSQEQADQKFDLWLQEKHNKISEKRQKVAAAKSTTMKSRLEQEAKVKEAKIAAMKAKEAEALKAEEAAPAEEAEATPAESPAEGEAAAEA
jgi:small subunit ribosomal protein S16